MLDGCGGGTMMRISSLNPCFILEKGLPSPSRGICVCELLHCVGVSRVIKRGWMNYRLHQLQYKCASNNSECISDPAFISTTTAASATFLCPLH